MSLKSMTALVRLKSHRKRMNRVVIWFHPFLTASL